MYYLTPHKKRLCEKFIFKNIRAIDKAIPWA
jgi:hypothetical protein